MLLPLVQSLCLDQTKSGTNTVRTEEWRGEYLGLISALKAAPDAVSRKVRREALGLL